MVETTSAEFATSMWPLHELGGEMRWREHGWKHVSYTDVESFWQDCCYGPESAHNKTEALGDKEVRKLFFDAANHDPEAVGILWTLFPNREDHDEIIETFFWRDERPTRIDDPSSVASDLVEKLFARPGSDESQNARKALLKMISVSVSRGTRSGKGRPKTRVARSSLRLLWKMSYSLVRQIVELNDFLGLYKETEKDRPRILLDAYPWITSVSRNLTNFLSYGPSKASLEVVGHLTGISSSYLEKMRLRSSSSD
jgi:hypothetical protein